MLERRATYLALVHNQYLVDMLAEEDVVAGRLKNYDVLYVTDANVATHAAATIEKWVNDGGWLYGACGAGSRNEFDEPSPGLAKTFGIDPSIQSEVQPGRYHVRAALNDMKYIDEMTVDSKTEPAESASFGVLGVKFGITPTTGRVNGKFQDGRPAVIVNDLGKGRAVYFAACPGLSYLKDAHFVAKELQEQYPQAQRRLINSFAALRGVPRLVELSHATVEAGIYDSPKGSALVLANFTHQPIDRLTVRVPLAKSIRTVRSVERGKLAFKLEKASTALQGQGYKHIAVFTTVLELNNIILLE